MKIKEFKFLTTEDKNELLYDNWSRTYEYPFVLDSIKSYGNNVEKVHNTSWGWYGVHVTFKETLDSIYPNCIHSDIKQSDLDKTKIWNITNLPEKNDIDFYDVVINVSTVEEVNYDHVTILENLFSMVRPGGILVVTMDVPGAQLDKITKWLGEEPKQSDKRITGNNSVLPNPRYGHLSVVGLVLEKTK